MGEPNAGIVSFRSAGIDSAAICARLREHSIVTAPRAGWVRASPHFYISPEDIERIRTYAKQMIAFLGSYVYPLLAGGQ